MSRNALAAVIAQATRTNTQSANPNSNQALAPYQPQRVSGGYRLDNRG
ncbi:hypothetical protein LOC67_15380 [Stieleria sp. JC731]|nr:hypothetical protein [Stieleria sp. JC731]MCC9601942.1 hypothetical protein [Stieleria sp. JC731]